MQDRQTFSIHHGIEDGHIDKALDLFWQAFRQKLAPVLKPEDKALQFLRRVVDPAHAISAVSSDGDLLGIAGFKTPAGAFIGGTLSDICAIYGALGGLWRGVLIDILERDLSEGGLLMDGIFVDPDARRKGVGTALLDAIAREARARDLAQVRLDVIDTNPRARALYERCGFVAGEVQELGLLRHLFGFRTATTMMLPV
ncbi:MULTISPECIES: GNAT family N-acetyltransferase [Thalassospira]|uniref:GNAT family N-acetyltransferase n=1 Tax=Thalassospira TaxID=168934 RepID=UPI0008DD0863|nr:MULTISPECIES: GNAT family N-acetyltransferase [Thalassospira]MDM7976516.1 GNAT family N-acetyltransferase [Thalassospira xiamenensis]OHY97334.1 molybdopterin-guanine dinucleotide biosynthesis protein MobC [Thalassospira sp. MIT1004]HBS22587.1 N-acetyltransferase [Thalassospira sp.]|tara:strand:+ start:388 stop:984 length:597 start_codon:yes stop_codon:yes gene_type:complete